MTAADLEPMTTYRFLAGLAAFGAEEWRQVEAASEPAMERLEEWDSAWNLVVALRLDGEARPALAEARAAGASLRVQALTGAACASIAARGQIGERRFRALYRPFAALLPAEPEAIRARHLYDRILAACPLKTAWR